MSQAEYEAEKARVLQPTVQEVVKHSVETYGKPAAKLTVQIALGLFVLFILFVIVMVSLDGGRF